MAKDAVKDLLEREVQSTSKLLRSLSGGGPIGLTPEHVKKTAEYRQAKSNYSAAFAALRAYNSKHSPRGTSPH